MKTDIKEIEVKEGKTLGELLDELQLSSAPILIEVGGKIFYPEEVRDRRLKEGDRVTIIPLIAGG